MQFRLPRRRFPRSLREWPKLRTFCEKSVFIFYWICSYGHEECNDYNIAQALFTKGRKNIAQCTKTVKNHIFQKNDLHKVPIASMNRWMQVDQPAVFFLAVSKSDLNFILFSKNPIFIFSLNIFLWTRRMQWLQPRRRVFDERPKFFSPDVLKR